MKYEGTYEDQKVVIAGWEYSAEGTDVNFSPTRPSHEVVWMRPQFVLIDQIPEGFTIVDAYDCWPTGMERVVDEAGRVVKRPPRGTLVIVPLPKEL